MPSGRTAPAQLSPRLIRFTFSIAGVGYRKRAVGISRQLDPVAVVWIVLQIGNERRLRVGLASGIGIMQIPETLESWRLLNHLQRCRLSALMSSVVTDNHDRVQSRIPPSRGGLSCKLPPRPTGWWGTSRRIPSLR